MTRLAALFAAVALLAWPAGAQEPPSEKGAGLPERTAPDGEYPDFQALTLPDLTGKPVDLESLLQGKVGLVAFWASWCQPCIAEIPTLRILQARYRVQGLVVVGIGLKQGGDNLDKQMQAARRNMMDYQLLFDEKDAYQKEFSMTKLPLNLLVDKNGQIRWRGPALPDDLDERVKQLLQEKTEG